MKAQMIDLVSIVGSDGGAGPLLLLQEERPKCPQEYFGMHYPYLSNISIYPKFMRFSTKTDMFHKLVFVHILITFPFTNKPVALKCMLIASK